MDRWNRYWFAPCSRHAVAILRIAVAASLLLTLWRIGTGPGDVDEAARARLYHPVGLLALFGASPPSPFTLALLRAIAWTAAAAMLVGFRARTATAIAAGASILLACHAESFTPSWSHSLNAPLLAAIALFGARTGDALAVDTWLSRRRGDPPPPAPTVAPLRMIQLAVGLMFVSAAMIKIASGGFTLDWALSDNLRHQILARFDMLQAPRTRAADWLVGEPWRWHLAGLFNLACQLSPLVAIAFADRPRVRAACAALFVVEVLALGIVMDLWNPQWLPLAAAFVDWDWLLPRRPRAAAARSPAPGRATRGWVATFVLVDVAASFAPGAFSQRLSLYPFSNFPMFSNIRAVRPYDEHLAYATLGQQIEIVAEPPLSRAEQDVVAGDIVYRRFYRLRDPSALRDALTVVIADARVRNPDIKVLGARLWLSEITVPAYPAPAHLDVRRVAVLAELAGADFRTELARTPAPPAAQKVVAAGEPLALTMVADIDGVSRPFLTAN